MERFKDRENAAQVLGRLLLPYQDEDPLILAIPRGGVPIAAGISKILHCPFDLLMVKKIGAPRQPELAVGAVSEDGKPIYNDGLVKTLGLSSTYLRQTAQQKTKEIQEQLQKFKVHRRTLDVKDRTVILVDDGIATGSTLFAAIEFLKGRRPRKLIVAAPVGAADSIEKLRRVTDVVVCPLVPDDFRAVGLWYDRFDQVPDEEVVRLLGEARLESKNYEEALTITDGPVELQGDLQRIAHGQGLIIFAHGSGSSRKSPRNRKVAAELNKLGFSTLLFDLLTPEEAEDRSNVFNIPLLSRRLLRATEAAVQAFAGEMMPIGYFGASTGAAAALAAAAQSAHSITAVVSRGGRPDLADEYLSRVPCPTLLIVGGKDTKVLEYNGLAERKIKNARMAIIPRATHLFEEPGAMEEVVELAANWFSKHLSSPMEEHPMEQIVHDLKDKGHAITTYESLDDLIKIMSTRRVVMLGEATHGTHEFYNIRRQISERLIQNHGFKFIAVEGDWPDCQKLNDYIQTGAGGSAREVMKQFHRWPTWLWANDETASLIEWMRNYKAGFYGLDVYSLFESIEHVIKFASEQDPKLAQEIRKQYSCFEPFERNEKSYASFLVKFPEGCRHEVLAGLRNLLRIHLSDLPADGKSLFNAQQNARIVAHAENYYRSMLFGGPQSWNVRDHHMMDTLDLLLQREGPDSKCIVWAHNSHIGDYHATDMLHEGYVNLGGLAREKYGMEQVFLLGFGTYEGKVLASPAWEGQESSIALPAAQEASFEDFCHKAAKEIHAGRFYVVFDDEARKGTLGTRSYGHRAVGVVYQAQFEKRGTNYVKTIPAQRYDGFYFVDQTTALQPIPTTKSKLDLPETWPGGV
nr:hypothetical protein BdHM001_33750 [Bdellovibrio sp. HM001]